MSYFDFGKAELFWLRPEEKQDHDDGDVILRRGASAIFASKIFGQEVYYQNKSARISSSSRVVGVTYPFDEDIAELPDKASTNIGQLKKMPWR